MSIVCSICSDVFGEHYKTVFTQCGHVFHSHCLKKWFKRSNTCPQCRTEITDGMLHKLFFTYSNQERDFVSLEDRNINLEYKILLKQSDIQYYKKKNETLEKQNAGLRNEVRKVEGEVSEKNAAIHALQEQIRYFKERTVDYDDTKEEIERLRKQLEEVRNVQRLLKAPTTNVRKLIGESRDPDILVRYISVMKGELIAHVRKIKQLRHKLVRLEKKLHETSGEFSVISERSGGPRDEVSDSIENSVENTNNRVTLSECKTDEYSDEGSLLRPAKKRIAHKSSKDTIHLPIVQGNRRSNDSVNEIFTASRKPRTSRMDDLQNSDGSLENSPECSYANEVSETDAKLKRRRLSLKNGREKIRKRKNTSSDVIDLT